MSDDGQRSEAQSMMRYDANKKSVLVAYLLWFFLGGLGIHRFYLGATTSAIILLILTIVGVVLTFALIGAFILIIPAIWLFVDIFLIPGLTRSYNNRLADQLA